MDSGSFSAAQLSLIISIIYYTAKLDDGTMAIIEVTIRNTLDQYETKLLERMDEKIHTHSADCEAKKFATVKMISSASVGGLIVAVGKWLVGKL